MKTNKKLHSIAVSFTVLVLFLIVLSSTASASITQTRITTSGSPEYPNSAIYGNKIVWADERNGASNIYMYDLSTKKESKITTSGRAHVPDIYGNKIVWVESRNADPSENANIYMYDLSTKKKTQIATGDVYDPVIYGNYVLYMTLIGEWQVALYDMSTKEATVISDYFSPNSQPAIYGNKIVWNSYDDMVNGYINLYDISTKKVTQVTTSGNEYNPDIYGNKIVWQDKSNGNWDIYIYDISTKKKTQITTSLSDSESPVIYGNNIVWSDNRNGNYNIYAYDLITHQQTHTTDKSDSASAISIYGNKIAWTDYRGEKSSVYVGTISYLPVAAFSASPTSGKHPLNVKFTDKSTDAYYWAWNFGDKSTSTAQSPTHKYTKAGKYTVKLIVKNAAGSNTKTMTNYITVK